MSSFFSSMVADKWFIYLVIYQNMTYCFLFQHNVVIIWYIFSFANLIQLNIVQRKLAGLPVFFNTKPLSNSGVQSILLQQEGIPNSPSLRRKHHKQHTYNKPNNQRNRVGHFSGHFQMITLQNIIV